MDQKTIWAIIGGALALWLITRKQVTAEELPGYEPYNPEGQPILWDE